MLILAGDLHIHIIYWPNIIRLAAVAYSPNRLILLFARRTKYNPRRSSRKFLAQI